VIHKGESDEWEFSEKHPIRLGEIEASLTRLRNRRDVLATRLAEAKIGCEKAQAAWESGLGDDPKALDKAGPRLSEAKEFGSLLESELDDYARQIAIVETELLLAQDRAAREAKADIFDSHAAAIQSMYQEYLEVSGRFGKLLGRTEGMLDSYTAGALSDAHAGGALVLQTRGELEGARDPILGQLQWMARELRQDPPPRPPEPSPMPAGTVPRGMFPDRNDPHFAADVGWQ
jgi:hypothetical protein